MFQAEFTLSPVTDTPFEALAERVQWSDPEITGDLRVMQEHGDWLVTTHQSDSGVTVVDSLVGFSVEAIDEGDITPPRELDDVKDRLGDRATFGEYGWFNGDMTAKGLGSMMAHTDYALQPRSVTGDRIAVRRIAFDSGTEVFDRHDSTSRAGRIGRIVRHGGLLAAATFGDVIGNSVGSQDPGTKLAMRYMERPYELARLVFMATPPIWQEQQARQHITPALPPHAVLARGGRYADKNAMQRIGSIPVQ